ncbi:Epidermal growth factor receptor kinase substrate 8-like protein 2 [Anabarilius grahami]|uniref:Epidermal growth factor receptor kinase substrate 8-like protein 2 n=1 Tax=Anabarilius grahami TaxID=495550 RepID=A0A3N0YB91_ANAGA|nr:Epidermal growth factor receptor kinase substrate 8-like protein 2 [Anabarilius grahami]
MGFEGDSFSSPTGSVILVSDSGSHPVASPDMDEDMLLATSSDELEMESVETDVSNKSVSCSTKQSPASNSDLQHVRIRYHFVARNANELSVQQGEVLEVWITLCEEVEEDGEQGRTGLRYSVWEVLENNKQWRLLRNRSGQSGYVPCNVLEEVKPGEQQYNRAALFNSQAVNPYKGTSAGPVNHTEVLEMNKSSRDKDNRNQQKEVNDELLKRITDNKAQPPARNFRVDRSSTSMAITYESQPFEVHAWLNAKGFSRPVVECLGILNGAQLFSLSKDELKAVCGDEGSRVFSQISVQKAQLERGRGDTELQEIMRRRQQEVEGSTWD